MIQSHQLHPTHLCVLRMLDTMKRPLKNSRNFHTCSVVNFIKGFLRMDSNWQGHSGKKETGPMKIEEKNDRLLWKQASSGSLSICGAFGHISKCYAYAAVPRQSVVYSFSPQTINLPTIASATARQHSGFGAPKRYTSLWICVRLGIWLRSGINVAVSRSVEACYGPQFMDWCIDIYSLHHLISVCIYIYIYIHLD